MISPKYRDVQTNPSIGDRGLIDIYMPEVSGKLPFILAIHGGGWVRGDRTSFKDFWPRLRHTGAAFVLCSYRVLAEAPYPAAYDDLLHLLKWLRRRGGDYNLDAGRCVLLGSSAGGHLAMLLGLRATKEESGICDVKGIVNYCGVMDLAAQHEYEQALGTTMTSDFIGGTPLNKAPLYAESSPVNHVHPGAPRVWMAHGTDDPTVPVDQSRRMVAALNAIGRAPTYTEAEGRVHTMLADDSAPLDKIEFLFEKDMLDFVSSCLR